MWEGFTFGSFLINVVSTLVLIALFPGRHSVWVQVPALIQWLQFRSPGRLGKQRKLVESLHDNPAELLRFGLYTLFDVLSTFFIGCMSLVFLWMLRSEIYQPSPPDWATLTEWLLVLAALLLTGMAALQLLSASVTLLNLKDYSGFMNKSAAREAELLRGAAPD